MQRQAWSLACGQDRRAHSLLGTGARGRALVTYDGQQLIRPQHRRIFVPPRPQRARIALVAAAAAVSSHSTEVTPSNTASRSGRWRQVWTVVDVLSIFGSVGGALSVLLGIFSASYALALPIVLPVVSLIAALERESLLREVKT